MAPAVGALRRRGGGKGWSSWRVRAGWSSPTGRRDAARRRSAAAVVADALRAVDPVGARGGRGRDELARAATCAHFRRLVEAGLLVAATPRSAIARDGLASLHARMRVIDADGRREPPARRFAAPDRRPLRDGHRRGGGGRGASGSSRCRTAGERLRGDDAAPRSWTPGSPPASSSRPAPRRCARSLANPDWLDLPGDTVVVLGAGAEMGPLTALLRWGADVVAVDLPRPAIWQRLLETAGRYGGRLHAAGRRRAPATDADLAAARRRRPAARACAGSRDWLGGARRRAGARQLRVRRRRDQRAGRRRPSTRSPRGCAATAAGPGAGVPGHADRRVRGPRRRGRRSRPARYARPRRHRPAAPAAADASAAAGCCAATTRPAPTRASTTAWCRSRGPNYALAKRLQRWRAAVARDAGTHGVASTSRRRPGPARC